MRERVLRADELTSKQLFAAVRAGDQTALEELYGRYNGLVYGVALRIARDARTAESICQDVFAALWRRGAADGAQDAAGWLLRMTRIAARAAAGRPVIDVADLEPVARGHVEAWSAASAARAVEQLDEDQRTALELGFFDGMTVDEIARETGAPRGTVKMRITSGLRSMRITLQIDRPESS